MDSALSTIASLLDSCGARRPDEHLQVWRLEYGPLWKFLTDAGVEHTKVSLLEAAWQLPATLFCAAGNQVEDDLKAFLRPDNGSWQIDTSRRAADFYATDSISRLGNWQIYAAERPVEALPDAHRTSASDLIDFMATNRIQLLIDAFHDNTDWCVATEGAEGTERRLRRVDRDGSSSA